MRSSSRAVASSEAELLAGATSRTPLRPGDGLSGVPMERVVIDGQRYVAKWLSADLDWVMRATRDEVCRPVVMWESGLYDEVAAYVDPVVVGAARSEAEGSCVLLMRDVADQFLPDGDAPISAQSQQQFLRDMAGLHAGFWGFTDTVGLCLPMDWYAAFSRETVAREAARGPLVGVPSYVVGGWDALHAAAPGVAADVDALASDPAPLVRALADTPSTLVHNDWKGGNLGHRPDGRTILVDWAFPSASGACCDLAWYLAVNCDRLPCSKEQTIAAYRAALEVHGVVAGDWWDRQLDLALLGAFVLLGWSKTGDAGELNWWVERVSDVARELLR